MSAVSLRRAYSDHPAVWYVAWTSSLLATRAVTMVDGLPRAAILQKKLTKKFEQFVSKNSNISGSMNSFGLVVIYTTLDISRIGLVHERASGYSLVQSLGGPTIFEKVENFENVKKIG